MNYDGNGEFHKTLLTVLAGRMRPGCFVELGLGTTPATPQVSEYCFVSHGVDHATLPGDKPENAFYHQMTTDDFFRTVAPTIPPIELALIDADHSKEAVIRDFVNLVRFAAENCIVMLHDTFPENKSQTNPEFCGDSYLATAQLKCEWVTLPCPPGVTLCRLHPRSRV